MVMPGAMAKLAAAQVYKCERRSIASFRRLSEIRRVALFGHDIIYGPSSFGVAGRAGWWRRSRNDSARV